MKDHLITVLEVLRAVRAELRTDESRRAQNDAQTIHRLKELLFDKKTTKALVILGAIDEAPSMVPDDHYEANEEAKYS